DAYLEDHAFLLEALIALFEATCEERWSDHAITLADELIARFADPDKGGFFSTASDGEALIARRKDLEDSPIPSGSSSAAVGLLRLSQLTGNSDYERHALSTIALAAEIAPRYPSAFGHMLQAMHWQLAPARPIACAVPGADATRTAR
ncbi:MAG TPA: thioredoxin domain-containing protein, partial [Solirubrobacteraceae bacterium]|nr:thioredoxin domain-containing protein [Solirubrobacteraceae bacterium]